MNTRSLSLARVIAFVLSSLCAVAAAAAEQPVTDAAEKLPQGMQAPRTAPVPLNSGLAPQQFPSDPGKVTMQQLPDGTRLYNLNGQGTQSVVAHLGKDGKIEYTCTDQGENALSRNGKERAREK